MAINVSVADVEVSETAASVTFTVVLSGDAHTTDLELVWETDYNASDTAASPGSDFVEASGTLIIPVGQTTGTITVNLLDDAVAEGIEYFFVTLTAPNPPVGQEVVIPDSRGYTAYAGLVDDEPSVTALDTVVDESAGTVTVTFQLSRPWGSAVSVDYQTTSATASDVAPAATVTNPTPVGDYTAASGTVTFAPGETVKTVTFTVNNDTLAEGREIYAVSLSNPVNAYLNESDSRAHIVIEDNDATAVATPTVNVFGGVVVEGQHAGVLFTPTGASGTASGAVEFLVLLSAPSTGTVTMNYSTANGTAVAGTDYTATTGTLTFAPGEVAKKVLVPILDNITADASLTRSFELEVSSISGATGGITYSNGTIVDNENATLPTASTPLEITAASVGDIIGTAFHDSLVGSSGDDILDGRAKPDTMVGGAGNDTYIFEDSGGSVIENFNEGTDTVITYLNNSQLGTYFERLYIGGSTGLQAVGNSSSTGNLMVGNIGNDTVYAWGGDDTVYGGAGNDSLYGDSTGDITLTGADLIYGEAGNDTLSGGDGNDTLDGGDGNDHLIGELSAAQDTIGTMTGVDSLLGGAGNDTLDGGRGADVLVGGVGDDIYYVDNVGDVVTEVVTTVGEASTVQGTDIIYSSVSYTIAANVETLTLTGTDNINATGDTAANVLNGNAGNNALSGGDGNDTLQSGDGDDTLTGGVGTDSLVGGAGNDLYYIDTATDVVTEAVGGGTDKLYAQVNWTMTAGAEVEVALLSGTATSLTGNALGNQLYGGTLNDTLSGMSGNDKLSGNAGNDSLLGGEGHDTLTGGAGTDTLVGGAGNDLYYIDTATDVVTEAVGGGTDKLYAQVDWTMTAGAEVESALLNGTATSLTGNELGNQLYGGSLNDTLSGMGGNDKLSGAAGNDSLLGGEGHDTLTGGAGTDTLVGGAGNDLYYIDTATDVVTEAVGGGTDKLYAQVDWTMTAGAEVESALLNGTATSLTGNELGNQLYGGSLNDTLSGMDGNDKLSGNAGNDSLLGGEGHDTLTGGAGTDTLVGGAGNDLYYIDTATDVVTEAVGGGTDKLYAQVDWTMTAGAEVESALLNGTATSLTGNELGNQLYGGSLNDTLSGMDGNDKLSGAAGNDSLLGGEGHDTLTGGAGTDTLVGGAGNDLYYIDTATDVVTEAVGGGTDKLYAQVNWTMTAGAEVESVLLSGTANSLTGNELGNQVYGGSLNDTLSGMAGNDKLSGNAGNDSLLGGEGNDTLTGGAGDDTFVFDTALSASTNVDRIADFASGDEFQLSAAIFTTLTTGGALSSTEFFSGAGLTGSTGVAQGDGIYYDTNTGSLYYDADGSGSGAGVKFAVVSGVPALTAADFIIGS